MKLTVYPQLVNKRNAQYAPQQGNITAAEGNVNCAAAGGAGLANGATAQAVFVTHHAFRLAAGNPMVGGHPSGLSMQAVTDALKGYGADATLYRGQSTDIARQALMDGHAVAMAINYQTINRNWPALSGQRDYNGGHFVVANGFRAGRHRNTVIYDALFDGRTRPWGKAPSGPQLARLAWYRQAMSDFVTSTGPVGPGLGIFIVVK